MTEQNFKNHVRLVPLHHFITPLLILLIMAGSFINLYKTCSNCTTRSEVYAQWYFV